MLPGGAVFFEALGHSWRGRFKELEGEPTWTVSPSWLASFVTWSQGSHGCPWPVHSWAGWLKCFSVSPFLGFVLGSPMMPHSPWNEGDLVNKIQPAGEEPACLVIFPYPLPALPYLQELDGHLEVSRGFFWSSGLQSIQEQYVRCWASSWSSASDVYEWNGVSAPAELGLREWLWTRRGRRGLVWNLYSSKTGSFRNWSLEKSENWHSSFAYPINTAELLKIPGAWLSLIAWEAERKPGLCLPGTFPPILCGLRRLGNCTDGFILPCENENTIQNCVLHSFKLVLKKKKRIQHR